MGSSDSRCGKDGRGSLFRCVALVLALATLTLTTRQQILGKLNSGVYDDVIKSATLRPFPSDEETNVKTALTPMFNSSFAEYLKRGLSWYIAKGGKKRYIYSDSYYLNKWPESHLPYWAAKRFPLNKFITSDKQTCLIHVGKAGGSTIGCLLGFFLHCEASNQTVSSVLTATTAHASHRCVHDCDNDAAYNLFVVRDPLARALSAFNYAKQELLEGKPYKAEWVRDKELMEDCDFWTLNDLAERALVRGSQNSTDECKDRAKQALLGTEPYVVHWYYNYQYYYNLVPPNASIVVIRNEHIVDDWNSVETMLGGSADMTQEMLPVNNAHEKKPEEMYLSDAAKVALCETLCNDIQVYKIILKRARNIKKEQYNQSMQELIAVCPKEAVEESCIDAQPGIQEKVDECY